MDWAFVSNVLLINLLSTIEKKIIPRIDSIDNADSASDEAPSEFEERHCH